MSIGIYALVCDKTWRAYVGQSTNLEKRKRQHFSELKNQRGINPEIQDDFNKFGRNSFHFEILEECNHEELIKLEKKWLDYSCNLYNIKRDELIITKDIVNQARFWTKIKILSDDECWEWLGCKSACGYGNIGIMINHKWKNVKSHRVAYYLVNPNIPQDTIVRHICNNPACCNPKHLTHGTYKQNAEDRLFNPNNNFLINKEDVSLIREHVHKFPNIKPQKFKEWFEEKTGKNISKCFVVDIAMNLAYYDKDYIPPHRTIGGLSKLIKDKIKEGFENNLTTKEIVEVVFENFQYVIHNSTICGLRRKYKQSL